MAKSTGLISVALNQRGRHKSQAGSPGLFKWWRGQLIISTFIVATWAESMVDIAVSVIGTATVNG